MFSRVGNRKSWFLLLNLVFLMGILFWLQADIEITRTGYGRITSSNTPDALYIAARRHLSGRVLEKIVKITDQRRRESMLELYVRLHTASNWWHPEYRDKLHASRLLADHYIDGFRWKALAQLGDAVAREDPRQADSYYWLGLARINQGQTQDAKRFFYQALSRQSTHEPALTELVTILLEEKKYREARERIDDYLMVKSIASGSPDIYLLNMYEQIGEQI